MIRKIVLALVAVVVVAIVGLVGWLAIAPPELLRVADGYAAKIVCSNVFIAGRDADEVLRVDVQAPGNPVLKLISVGVDKAAGTVTARMLGFAAPQVAVSRPDYGDVSDVNRMLFLEPDLAKFAASQALTAKPGTAFNYSSGTGVMLSRIWMDRAGPDAAGYP